uniref:Uncharacterized protein n=1 Tax=Oryza meridionalis TaxID=40149 RepID=A0A0E0FBI8_9ORYZ
MTSTTPPVQIRRCHVFSSTPSCLSSSPSPPPTSTTPTASSTTTVSLHNAAPADLLHQDTAGFLPLSTRLHDAVGLPPKLPASTKPPSPPTGCK